jgi:hypothetical protein
VNDIVVLPDLKTEQHPMHTLGAPLSNNNAMSSLGNQGQEDAISKTQDEIYIILNTDNHLDLLDGVQ